MRREATVPAGKPTPEANCELQVEPEGGAPMGVQLPSGAWGAAFFL